MDIPIEQMEVDFFLDQVHTITERAEQMRNILYEKADFRHIGRAMDIGLSRLEEAEGHFKMVRGALFYEEMHQ